MSTPGTELPARPAAGDAPAQLDQRLSGLPARAQRQLREARQALEMRNARQADAALERAAEAAGAHPEYLRLFGITRHLQGRPAEAVAALRRALDKVPGDALTLTNLGTALRAAGDFEAAVVALRRACDVAPDLAAGWYNLGRALGSAGRTGEAHEAYEQALRCDPTHVNARISYADTLRIFGRIDEATAAYRAVLGKPGAIQAWLRIANMQTVKFTAAETAELERLFVAPTTSENDRVVVGFALAKAFEDLGRHAEAFTVLSTANAIKRRHVQWDAQQFSQRIDAIMKTFARAPATASPPELGREVIFIVSLPRSGSTLTEQILASHPDVEGGNELPDLGNVLDEESKRTGLEFPDWVPQATPEDWRRLGESYLERTARFRRDRGRFTDKALSNWRVVGAAMAMLPGARFVNCRRDPVETCLSCFRQVFTRGQAFTYDLQDLAAYWRDYDRLMRFWNARYPHAVRDQVYEKLVEDPEGEVRALLAFCGLEFDPACLRFYETPRNVRTISAAQVREPLRRDTARAPLYRELLTPLRLALGVR
ncbi:MAG TPA: sulfotransferase [Rhodanobacteraceae bacterium]|nr:sulfotransferase [Rhodanobacteraceae bacterium]